MDLWDAKPLYTYIPAHKMDPKVGGAATHCYIPERYGLLLEEMNQALALLDLNTDCFF